MIIDKNHILKLADLSNLTLTEEEIDSYINDINKILDLISDINDVDTKGVKPLYNVLEQFSETRDDVESIRSDREEVLGNSPESDGIYFQVPQTIKHNKEKDKNGEE